MADEIKLIVRVEGKGVTELRGNVDQLKNAVKNFAREPWISNAQRRQLAQLRNELDLISARAQSTGRVLQSVSATAFRANRSSLRTSYSATDSGTYQAQQTKIQEREAKKQQAILDRQAAAQKRIEEQQIKQREESRRRWGRSVMGTLGFGGLQISQMFSGMLDNINFTGALSPAISKVGGVLGSMFGDMFSSVLSNLGAAIGTTAEAIANLITNVFKTTFKAIGSFFAGIAMSLINVMLAPVTNLLIGTITGLTMAAMSVVQGLIEGMISLFKDFVKIIGSLLTAAFELIKGLFSTFAGIVSSLWNGIWEGLKATAQAAWDFITSITRSGFESLTKSFQDYAASQKLAARVFQQVNDMAQYQNLSITQGAEKFRNLAQEMSTKFVVATDDVIKGFYKITSAGIGSEETIRKISEAVGTMSAMSQHEDTFENLSQTLVKASQAYGITGDEITRFAAIISAGTKMGSYDLSEYNSAIQSVIGSAAEAKVPFDQLNMILALTSRSGLSLNRVTVGMNRLFDTLTNPTKKNASAIKELGIDVNALRASGKSLIDILVEMEDKVPADKMREMFGTVQGVRAFRAIKSQMDSTSESSKRMSDMVRDFGKGLDDALGLAANRMERTKIAWDNFKRSLSGRLFDDILKSGLDIIDEVIAKLVNFVSTLDFTPLTKSISEGIKNIWNTVKQLPEYIAKITGVSINWNGIIKEIASYVTKITNVLADPKTWTTVLRSVYLFVGYLGVGYEYIKKIFTDMTFADKMFSSLGEIIKNIGIFLVQTFKDAFEVAAAYAQSTFLPVFKIAAKEFGSYILGSIGDAMGVLSVSAQAESRKTDASGKRSHDLFSQVALAGIGGAFGAVGNAANTQSLAWKNVGREETNPESIFNVLKPILETAVRDGNKSLIDSLALASINERSVKFKDYENKDQMRVAAFLSKIVSSPNLETALSESEKNGVGIDKRDSFYILNKILYALTEKGSLFKITEGLNNDNLRGLLESFGRSTAIQKERDEGKNKFGNIDFTGRLGSNFNALTDSLNNIMNNVGATLKNTDPELFDKIAKLQENANKINFEIAQEQKKNTQENTNAVKENTQVHKNKEPVKDMYKHITRYVPAANAEGYMRKMRNMYPNMTVEAGGTVRTGRGNMRAIEIGVDLNNLKQSIDKNTKEQKDRKDKIMQEKQKEKTVTAVSLEEINRNRLENTERQKRISERLGTKEYEEKWKRMMNETNGAALGQDADEYFKNKKDEGTTKVVESLDGIATLTKSMLEELKQINRKPTNQIAVQPPQESFWRKAANLTDIWEQN